MVAAANLVEVAALAGVAKFWRDKPCRERRHQPSSAAQLHRKKQRVVEIRLMSLVASARHVVLLCQRIRSTPELHRIRRLIRVSGTIRREATNP